MGDGRMNREDILDYLDDLADTLIDTDIADVLTVEESIDYNEDRQPERYRITFSWPLRDVGDKDKE